MVMLGNVLVFRKPKAPLVQGNGKLA